MKEISSQRPFRRKSEKKVQISGINLCAMGEGAMELCVQVRHKIWQLTKVFNIITSINQERKCNLMRFTVPYLEFLTDYDDYSRHSFDGYQSQNSSSHESVDSLILVSAPHFNCACIMIIKCLLFQKSNNQQLQVFTFVLLYINFLLVFICCSIIYLCSVEYIALVHALINTICLKFNCHLVVTKVTNNKGVTVSSC